MMFPRGSYSVIVTLRMRKLEHQNVPEYLEFSLVAAGGQEFQNSRLSPDPASEYHSAPPPSYVSRN